MDGADGGGANKGGTTVAVGAIGGRNRVGRGDGGSGSGRRGRVAGCGEEVGVDGGAEGGGQR